jgi:hypothetical protein
VAGLHANELLRDERCDNRGRQACRRRFAPEAVAARAAKPVARGQLDRGWRACPPPSPPPPYSPTALAAFSRNREPSRM